MPKSPRKKRSIEAIFGDIADLPAADDGPPTAAVSRDSDSPKAGAAICPYHPLTGQAEGAPRHLSEQYLTFSQSRCHFFRQANGRPQVAQILVGRVSFL